MPKTLSFGRVITIGTLELPAVEQRCLREADVLTLVYVRTAWFYTYILREFGGSRSGAPLAAGLCSQGCHRCACLLRRPVLRS